MLVSLRGAPARMLRTPNQLSDRPLRDDLLHDDLLHDDRGDVPGWVLITLMTAGLQ